MLIRPRSFFTYGAAALVALWLACVPVAQATGDDDLVADMAVAERLMRAFDLLGTPYRKRGAAPDTGFDCSGFVGWVFRQANGVALPRSAREMFALGSERAAEVAREALRPGDLVFFRIGRLGKVIDHVGLYVGDGRFIHAPASGGQVRIDPIDQPYWAKHYAGARRVAGALPVAVASAQQADPAAAPEAVGTDNEITNGGTAP